MISDIDGVEVLCDLEVRNKVNASNLLHLCFCACFGRRVNDDDIW